MTDKITVTMKNYQPKKQNISLLPLLLLLFLLPACIACQSKEQKARIEILFDDDWKFQLGDVEGAEKFSFHDDTWRSLD